MKELKNEAFLLNIQKNQLITLNETGLEIWKTLWKSRTQNEIVAILIKRYEARIDIVEKDVDAFLKSALQHNLILTV